MVMIVKPQPCCGSTKTNGQIFKIKNIRRPYGIGSECALCGAITKDVLLVEGKQNGRLTHLSRLKRIPPLDELEGVKSSENIKEPA